MNRIEKIFNNPKLKSVLLPTTMFFFGYAAFSAIKFHTLLLERHHHFTAEEIGNTLMLTASTQIIISLILIKATKYIKNQGRILSILYLIYSICLALLPHLESKTSVVICFFIMTFCSSGFFPLQTTTILNVSRELKDGWFLFLRSIGTLGFASFCFISAFLTKYYELHQVYWLFSAAAFIAFLLSFKNKGIVSHKTIEVKIISSLKLLFQGNTLLYLIAMFIANMAIFSATTLIGNFMRLELNATNHDVSFSWTLSTLVEIPLMWFTIILLSKIGLKKTILVGLLSATLRCFLTWTSTSINGFIVVQLLHGLFYSCAISGFSLHLRQQFPTDKIYGLQIISGCIYFGIASSLGGKLSGMCWEYFGIRQLYLFSAIACLVATIIVMKVKEDKPDIKVVESHS